VKSSVVVPHKEATFRMSVGLPLYALKSTAEPSSAVADWSKKTDIAGDAERMPRVAGAEPATKP